MSAARSLFRGRLATVAFAVALLASPARGKTPAPSHARVATRPVVFRIRSGARADLGWTGIAHRQSWPTDQLLGFALDCTSGDGSCRATGGAAGDFFGAPIPLSSGGVPACIVNRLREGVGGSVGPKTGCGELQIHLTSTVFVAEDVARPCPTCRGDATANDGHKDGRCEGGATPGAACDDNGASARFGSTSNDCLPAGTSAGELPIDLAPLTTGEVRLQAREECAGARNHDGPACLCAGQAQPNACIGGRCPAGRCKDGPLDGTCDRASYRGCRPGTGRQDCDALIAGSGACTASLRSCLSETLAAAGRCDPKTPTYVAVFCVPPTRATALNTAAGLPGPARLVLPLERVR